MSANETPTSRAPSMQPEPSARLTVSLNNGHNETPRAPSMQPEPSAGPTVSLNNVQRAETPVAAAPAEERRTTQSAAPKETKPRLTRACEECRVKKMRCPHRQIITPGGNIPIPAENRATVSPEVVRSEQPEHSQQSQQPGEPQPKRVLRTVRKSAHNEVIVSAPVPVAKPQPRRKAAASRKGKRRQAETEEPSVVASASTKGAAAAGRTLSAEQIGSLPVDQSLNGFGAFKWAETMIDVFEQAVKEANAQWERTCKAREVVDSRWKKTYEAMEESHDEHNTYTEKVNRVHYVMTEWKKGLEQP